MTYSVLKVPLNPNQPTNPGSEIWHGGVDQLLIWHGVDLLLRSIPPIQISPPLVQRVASVGRKTSRVTWISALCAMCNAAGKKSAVHNDRNNNNRMFVRLGYKCKITRVWFSRSFKTSSQCYPYVHINENNLYINKVQMKNAVLCHYSAQEINYSFRKEVTDYP